MTEPDAPIRQTMGRLSVETWSKTFIDITPALADWLRDVGALDGLLTIFIRHTSASLTIQENTDADVRRDLSDAFDRLAPDDAEYRHHLEGPDDMPAHIKSVLTDTSLTIPVLDGAPDLGTWQAVYVIEHRARNHSRTLTVTFQGSFER
ncbi:MAG: secondary thiamine-phosphate synthase enzyme YjbQ [Rhodobiaceae bacterium]|nr:secondary thiamine-phosphate synthase enzyme YjbQ [Rhodobiaceae bacterium]